MLKYMRGLHLPHPTPLPSHNDNRTCSPNAMSSIYRASPSKRTKAGAGGGTARSRGGGGSGSWTLVGPDRDPAPGNRDWLCRRQGCDGFIVARTRKDSTSQYVRCLRHPQDCRPEIFNDYAAVQPPGIYRAINIYQVPRTYGVGTHVYSRLRYMIL